MGLQYTDALVRATVLTLVSGATITATENSATAVLPAGVKGDAAVLANIDGDTAGTASTMSLQVQSSPHGAATWTNVGAAVPAAITGTPFRGLISFDSGSVTGSDIRVVVTIAAGSGSTPSYKGSLALLAWVP
ncbi:MAG TPA: hypothetical protein VK635_34290 [Bradyrhizobium sp.]|nr:hypothetical protein [Bradyrhizobium sp.]